MSDVFISYSRRDIAFARLLHNALKEHEFETWIDWQDIPPSADWLAEVYEAIEGADTFMFVISDGSLTSEICGLEVEHAVRNHKRLIPIVVNEVDPQLVHPALAALNWVFFRQEDEFAGAFKALFQAIETDLEWVKGHTRLQVRALEWDRKDRESGFLLRGRDLEEAEVWLAQAGGKGQAPTGIQGEYIVASRQSATRRQRTTLSAVVIALLALAVLGILAWTQRNKAVYEGEVRATAEAIAVAESTRALNAEATALAERSIAQAESTRAVQAENTAVAERGTAQAESTRAIRAEATAQAEREIAQTEAAIARSRQLASASADQLPFNYEVALLLAIEARRSAGTGEAETALRESFVHPGRSQALLVGHEGAVLDLAWSPDGATIVTAGADGTVRIWDPSGGLEIKLLTGHDGAVLDIAWDETGGRLASVGEDGTARIWDVESGHELHHLDNLAGPVEHATWNAAGTQILTSGGEGSAQIWDARTGQELIALGEPGTAVRYAAWGPDETLIATVGGDDLVRIRDVETGEVLATLEGSFGGIWYAAWNGDGSLLVTDGLGEAQVWDVAAATTAGPEAEATALTRYEHAIPSYEIGRLAHLVWSSDGRKILSVSTNGTAEIWEAESGRTVAQLEGHTEAVRFGAWNIDASRVLTISDDDTVRVWDASDGRSIAVLAGHQGPITHATWNRDETRVATASVDGTVRIWSVDAVEELASFFCSVQERSLWSPDGTMILTSGYGPLLWDSASGDELAAFGEDLGSWDPAGERLLTGYGENGAAIWDLTALLKEDDPQPTLLLPAGEGAAWSADGQAVLAIDAAGTVRVWDAATGVRTVTFASDESTISTAIWSPDSARILTLEQEGPVRIWDVGDGVQLLSYDGHTEMVQSAAWSPDGEQVVTAGRDGTAQVWDAATGQALVVYDVHTAYVQAAAWSPDGTRIVTAGNDNNAQIWDAQSGVTLATLAGHSASVDFAAWNADGTVLATTSWDYTARIWDAANGNELAVIAGYFDTVRHAAWSPEGDRLVVTSWGEPARLFDVPLLDMLNRACSRVVRNLSVAEWEQFMGDRPYQETCPGKPVPGRDFSEHGGD